MTEDHPNVALLKRLDLHDVAAFKSLIAEDIVWHYANPNLPDQQGNYVGLDNVRSLGKPPLSGSPWLLFRQRMLSKGAAIQAESIHQYNSPLPNFCCHRDALGPLTYQARKSGPTHYS